MAENGNNVAKLSAETMRSEKPVTLWRTAWRRLFRRKSAVLGMVILGVLVLIAIFADWLAPYDPYQVLIGVEDVKMRQAPCIHLLGCPEDQPQHLMGIDGNVRDMFSRLLYGARLSLIVGFTTVSFAIVIGVTLGALSGYLGGWVDNVIMRMMDVLLAFPSLLLAIAIVTILGPGIENALLAIGIVSIPAYARVTRASVLTVKQMEFVDASRSLGGGTFYILVWPHLAQFAHPADRAGHAGDRHCHPGCRGAVLPGAGRSATHPGVGLYVERRAQPGFSPPRTWFFILVWPSC